MKIKLLLCLWVQGSLLLGGAYQDRHEPVPSDLKLKEIIEAVEAPGSQIRSVESLLEWIGSKTPTFFDHYTLVRKSDSQQSASDTFPRAIVYGSDSKLLMTFNGEKSQTGYQKVEFIQFDSSQDKLLDGKTGPSDYEFRELDFSKRNPVSEKNPAKCMQCHFQPLRPIWQAYDQWPGLYGADDDAIPDMDNDKYAFRGQSDDYVAAAKTQLAGFRSYQAVRDTHPRYSYLKVEKDSSVAPYNPNRRGDYKFRTNLRLTHQLSGWHAQVLAERVLRQTALRGVPLELFMMNILKCHTSMNSDLVSREAAAGQLASFSVDGTVPWSKYPGNISWSPKIELLRLSGFEAADWNMERQPSRWEFYVGAEYLTHLVVDKLLVELGKKYSGLVSREDFSKYRYESVYGSPTDYGVDESEAGEAKQLLSAKDRLCQTLVQQEHLVLTVHKSAEEARDGIPAAIQMCQSCHSGGNAVPRIDFSNLSTTLQRKILSRVDGSHAQQMPPMRSLMEHERRQIEGFLGR